MSNASSKTRRGLTIYQENPFITIDTVKTRVKRITNRKGDMFVKAEDESIVAPAAGFWQAQEVDTAQFVKLYINGVKAFSELTNAGTKVFELLYREMQKNIGKDRVYLSFTAIEYEMGEELKVSQATFTRGMRELIDKGFLAPAIGVGWYWINPDFVFNGDRLTFVKEYRRASANGKSKQQVPGQVVMDVTALLGEGEKVSK